MPPPITSFDFDLPPVTPTLPPDPQIYDYERAIEYERRKLAQIRKTSEQLKIEYAHLNGDCDSAMMGQNHTSAERDSNTVKKENQALQTPSHSKTPSTETTPSSGPAATSHVRRKSSLNACAPEFIPGSMGDKKPDAPKS